VAIFFVACKEMQKVSKHRTNKSRNIKQKHRTIVNSAECGAHFILQVEKCRISLDPIS
jgi:hypothetical protein